jgi:hypothetical protein
MNGNNSGFNSSVGFSSSHATITPANASMLKKEWTATSGGPAFAQPIVANGNLYWGSFDGYERATRTSGDLVWKTFLGTTTPPAGTCLPPSAGVASTATYRTDVSIGRSNAVLFVGGAMPPSTRRAHRQGAVAPLARHDRATSSGTRRPTTRAASTSVSRHTASARTCRAVLSASTHAHRQDPQNVEPDAGRLHRRRDMGLTRHRPLPATPCTS